MVSICPTITTDNIETFESQVKQYAEFVTRLHIDISDGNFAPASLVELENIWWPANVRADIHLMSFRPFDNIELLIKLSPQLVIVHAEAEGNFIEFAERLHRHGVEVGVALLPDTPVQEIAPAIENIDHVLIFSGKLGHYGGKSDLSLLKKATDIRQISQRVEIGWDGGINLENAEQLTAGGIQVLNVGGYMHSAEHPAAAYKKLETLLAPPIKRIKVF